MIKYISIVIIIILMVLSILLLKIVGWGQAYIEMQLSVYDTSSKTTEGKLNNITMFS
jgi:hypothetical protein